LTAASLAIAKDGGYLGVAYTTPGSGYIPAVHTIKMNSTGVVEWAKTYDGKEATFVHRTRDDGYILTGNRIASLPINNTPILLKIDKTGNVVWSKSYGIAGNDSKAYCVKETDDNGYIMVAQTGSNKDISLIKTDEDGNTGCSDSTLSNIDHFLNTTMYNIPPLIFVDTFANESITHVIGLGGKDSVLCSTLSVHEITPSIGETTVYPNPTSGVVNIKSLEAIGRVRIFSFTGVAVCNKVLQTRNASVDLSSYSSGAYFYTITSANGRIETGKIILK
jgi:hypothetical protein